MQLNPMDEQQNRKKTHVYAKRNINKKNIKLYVDGFLLIITI